MDFTSYYLKVSSHSRSLNVAKARGMGWYLPVPSRKAESSLPPLPGGEGNAKKVRKKSYSFVRMRTWSFFPMTQRETFVKMPFATTHGMLFISPSISSGSSMVILASIM